MKEMIKKVKERREGFTMAELLIVVAIIAVLVAIAIPVFTSQLEKSRESVDAANIRAAYAEVVAAALTGEVDATSGNTQAYTVTIAADKATITATGALVQEKAGWTGDAPAIGGYTLPGTSADTNTKWTLTYTVATEAIAVTYAD